MKKYRVVWGITLEAEVLAEDRRDAIEIVCSMDCQHGGEYVANSFKIIKTEEVESE